MKYEVIEATGTAPACIRAEDENGVISFIPLDESNSDYQRYLRWLEDPTAEESGTLS